MNNFSTLEKILIAVGLYISVFILSVGFGITTGDYVLVIAPIVMTVITIWAVYEAYAEYTNEYYDTQED